MYTENVRVWRRDILKIIFSSSKKNRRLFKGVMKTITEFLTSERA